MFVSLFFVVVAFGIAGVGGGGGAYLRLSAH